MSIRRTVTEESFEFLEFEAIVRYSWELRLVARFFAFGRFE